MAGDPKTSRLFNAVSDVLRRPSMRPVTRTFSTLHALTYRATRGKAQNSKYPTMLLTVTGECFGYGTQLSAEVAKALPGVVHHIEEIIEETVHPKQKAHA